MSDILPWIFLFLLVLVIGIKLLAWILVFALMYWIIVEVRK